MTDLFGSIGLDLPRMQVQAEPISDDHSTRFVGAWGECFVRQDLMWQGMACSSAEAFECFDLIANACGALLRIQVKTCQRPVKWKASTDVPHYVFTSNRAGYSLGDVDLFAFVASDVRTIAYVPGHEPFSGALRLYPKGTPKNRTGRDRRFGNINEYPLHAALRGIGFDPAKLRALG